MKTTKVVFLYLCCVVCIVFPTINWSQTKPVVNDILYQQALKSISASKKGFKANYDLANKLLSSTYSTDSKLTHFYFIQEIDGISVHNAVSNVAIDENGEVFQTNVTHFDYPISTQKSTKRISAEEAIMACASYFNLPVIGVSQRLKSNKSSDFAGTFSNSALSQQEISTKLTYFPIDGELSLCWSVAFENKQDNFWYNMMVDASTGAVTKEITWTVECNWDHAHNRERGSCSHESSESHHHTHATKSLQQSMSTGNYKVLPLPYESPNETAFTMVQRPWEAAPNASPYGWHDTNGANGAEYTITRGNNVYASEDTDNNNLPGFAPDGGSSLTFDFPIDLATQEPEEYFGAAITNLFYWNNIIHDILVNYGFDEASGNFQERNYTGLGLGSDFVYADCLDGSGVNNANFSTPPDGFNGRMQMYKWFPSNTTTEFTVNNSPASGGYAAIQSRFGAQNLAPITANLALVNDGSGTRTDACSNFSQSALSGRIAVIDRGGCTFVEKVQRAQSNGAVAAIICNNTSGLVRPGGTSSSIVIPSAMITKNDCDKIKVAMQNQSVSATLDVNQENIPNRDSDLDNGIIAHEYGHGWSIRLTGGAASSSCLNNEEQMGEGWSDFLAMILTMKADDTKNDARGIGNYVLGQNELGYGIRPAPYSYDMSKNELTYASLPSSSIVAPHGVGTVWCTMLWDMTWNLVDRYGFDPDVYNGTGGNNIALRLVTEALKLQPCSPGFVDGRDAILAADQALYDGANQCLIWDAFARRGLGINASQGSSNSKTDGTVDFTAPTNCIFVDIDVDNSLVVDGDQLNFSIKVTNSAQQSINNINIQNSIPAQLDYVNNSLTCSSTVNNNNISISTGSISGGQIVNCQYDAIVDANLQPNTSFEDDVESGNNGWNAVVGTGTNSWSRTTSRRNSGSRSWYIPNQATLNTHYLQSPVLALGDNPSLRFMHYYDTESGWDGGYIEIKRQGQSNWNKITTGLFVKNGYNSTLGTHDNPAANGHLAFSGKSSGFIETVALLSGYENSNVQIRFVFAEDSNTSSDGWYVDDIAIINDYATKISNQACFSTNSQFLSCQTVTIGVLACLNCEVPGCTDPNSLNYNPDANVNDGSCFNCQDGVQNGNETGVDCGGACLPCHCNDGVQSGDETGVDCGGSCPVKCCTTNSLLMYNGPYNINTGEITTSSSIMLDGTGGSVMVQNNATVELTAKQEVEIKPTFEVTAGSELIINIEDCKN